MSNLLLRTILGEDPSEGADLNEQVADPLADFLARREAIAPLITTKQADECFEAAVKSCTAKMILFLQDPGIQARLRNDLPLFEED